MQGIHSFLDSTTQTEPNCVLEQFEARGSERRKNTPNDSERHLPKKGKQLFLRLRVTHALVLQWTQSTQCSNRLRAHPNARDSLSSAPAWAPEAAGKPGRCSRPPAAAAHTTRRNGRCQNAAPHMTSNTQPPEPGPPEQLAPPGKPPPAAPPALALARAALSREEPPGQQKARRAAE